MIPISTTYSDPLWYHDFTRNYNYIFQDKRRIYNGIRANIFLMPKDYKCECGPSCIEHNPANCDFLKDYRVHLDTLDFNYVIKQLERIARDIQEIEGFEEEPIIVLIVYETPSNPCSERGPLQDWFKKHGVDVKELQFLDKKPIV